MGNLEPRKNLETLVGAFDMAVGKSGMRDLHLVLAGNVGWKNKNIFRAIQAAKHKKKIHLLGYVRAEDRRYIYSLARMFVFPSFYEGFGIPPLESMACGTPVVASHTSSLGEVVGANGILIDPYDKKDLADAMRELNKDDDLCELLRRKGLERANNFSWKKAARQYFDIFENYG
jgi:glycosyltransferase involved in cell wall biosynthesis